MKEQQEIAKQAILQGSIFVELLEELNAKQQLKQQINRTISMMEKYLLPSYDAIHKEDSQITLGMSKQYEKSIEWMVKSPIEKQLQLFKKINEEDVNGNETINLEKFE
jgi:hypothetical protein